MLELRVKPTKKRQFLMKAMPVTILLTNNSQENIQISDKSMEIELEILAIWNRLILE